MGRSFKIYLLCLMTVAVLIGAVAIFYPLISQSDQPYTTPQVTLTQPTVTEEPEPEPEPETEVEEVVEKAEPLPIPETADPAILTMMDDMTLEEKIYQLFFVTPEAITGVTTATLAGEATKTAIETYPVGGIIYFADNLENTDQVTTLLGNTQSYSQIPLFLGVDEEGGTVSRLGSNSQIDVTRLSSMSSYNDAQEVYQIGRTLASEMSALGFNLNFAPVADVVTNDNNTEIGERSFSTDPVVAAQMVGSMVSGLQEKGVAATLKHFPGNGSTETDSHDGTSVSNRTLDELRACEFLPFQSGIEAGAGLVMVGHQTMEAISGADDYPSSMSEFVVSDLLRGELGFTGVIITDALNMGAITNNYSAAEAAVSAIYAGVDMLLIPEDLEEAVQGLADAIEDGTLTEERIDQSVYRILNLKSNQGILDD